MLFTLCLPGLPSLEISLALFDSAFAYGASSISQMMLDERDEPKKKKLFCPTYNVKIVKSEASPRRRRHCSLAAYE